MNSLKNLYEKFKNEMNYIDKYLTLTSFSYDVSRFQFVKNAPMYQEYIEPLNNIQNDKGNEISENDLDEICMWISINDYAEREQISTAEIEKKIVNGILGNAIHFAGDWFLIWPPKFQDYPSEKLPSIHDQIFHVFSDEMYETIQEYHKSEESKEFDKEFTEFLEKENIDPIKNAEFIALSQIKRLGAYETVFREAGHKLFSSCFLLTWIAFEDFINAIILELYKLFPEKVIQNGNNGDQKLRFVEIYKYSNNFKKIDSLANHILTILLNKEEQTHDGIHSRMIFLKSNFLGNVDIYKAPIYIDEELETTSYSEIDEFRNVRNNIVHNNSFATESFFNSFPNVPRENHRIKITDRYLDVFSEKIRAISYYIYKTIKENYLE